MLAVVGVQVPNAIVRVTGTVPLFLIQTFWLTVLPGLTVPTLSDVQGIVNAASEYKSTFTAVIDPRRGKLWESLRAAMVVTVRRTAAIAIAATAIGGGLFAMSINPSNPCQVS